MEHKKDISIAVRLSSAADRLPLTLHNCRIPWRDVADRRVYTNPYELLTRGNETAVSALLAASASVTGVEVTDDASDYDKFAALCAALPLWAGHPLYAAMHGVLAKVTGCTLSMTTTNAPLIWKAYAAQTAAAPLGVGDALVKLGVETLYLGVSTDEWCAIPDGVWKHAAPRLAITPMLCLDDLTQPLGTDLASCTVALSDTICNFAAKGGTRVMIGLPHGWSFTRPNPYGADETMKKLSAGQGVSREEDCILTAQLLRVVGQACVRENIELALNGGTSAEVGRLVAYLSACNGHRTLRYTPAVAGDVAAVLGTPGVTFGLPLTAADTLCTVKQKLMAHAAVAPLGALVGADMPIQALTDVWMLMEARRALCDLLTAWRREGDAPPDFNALCAVWARI